MFSAGAELAEYWNGSSPTAGDAELFHAGFQGGRLHAQEPGRTAVPADSPARPLEHRQDVFAFNLFEGLGLPLGRDGARAWKPSAEIHVRPLAENQCALDDILEFPDVPGPQIGPQTLQRRRQDARDTLPQPPTILLGEVPDQEWNVLRSLPERWQANWEDAQPVVEIGTEPTRLNGLLQVPVCCGDHPHVYPNRVGAADPLELALLEDAEELWLQFQRQIPDLVQEERAPVSELEPPNPAGQCASEGALLVSEQFTLDQSGG